MHKLRLRLLLLIFLLVLNQALPIGIATLRSTYTKITPTVNAAESAVLPDQEFEITSLRTENSKTFSITREGVTTKRLKQVAYPLHYLDEHGEWQDIDLQWHAQNDGSFDNTKNSFQSFLPAKTTDATAARIEKGNFWAEVAIETTVGIRGELVGTGREQRVVYPNAYHGLDVAFGLDPDRLIKEFVLTERPDTAPELSFVVTLSPTTTVELRNGTVVFLQNNEPIAYIPAPFMYQREHKERGWMKTEGGVQLELQQIGPTQYKILKRITPEGMEWLQAEDRQFPVAIDATVNVQVSTSGDDGDVHTYSDGLNSLTRAFLPVGSYSGVSHLVAARFLNITVPNSETITSAEFVVASVATTSCGCNLPIGFYLEAADNSAVFTLTNMNDRPAAAAYTEVNIPSMTADVQIGYDVTDAVQEVVDRAGWSSGNAMTVFAVDHGADYAMTQELWSYDGNPTLAPQLIIEYGSSANLEQEGYRWRDDNASESSGWLESEDTPITQPIETITRLRTLINATDDPNSNQYQLEYKLSSDPNYTPVGPTPETATPTVQTRSTGATTTTNTTSHAITMPSGIQAGDLLIIVFSCDGGAQRMSIADEGWIRLDRDANGANVASAVFYKFATGSDTATVSTSASEQSSHVVLRISGAGVPYSAKSNGASTNSNPPSLNMGTSRNHLWVATRSGDSTVVASAAPSSYGNLQTQAAAGTGGASTNTAERSVAGSSEDPGTFTSANEQWVSFTIGIPPADTTMGATYASIAANGTTSLSVAYPPDIDAGDLLVMTVGNKYPTNGPSTPSGWDAPSNYQGTGGSGSSGNDSGSTYSSVYTRIADGTETGNQSVTITSGNVSIGRLYLFKRVSGKIWDVSMANGGDSTVDTTWSVTAGTDPGFAAGDVVLTASAINTDATYVYEAPTLTSTGVTFTGEVVTHHYVSATGQDASLINSIHRVASGTSSGAPTFTMTSSTSGTNAPAGASVIVRIRQLDAPIILADSSNISASGQSTTAQLTAPSGKSTSDFVTGRMQDDENPADTIDITTDDYTEVEWSLEATSQATNGQMYQFRVTNNGTPLDTYSVTPEWTIGTVGGNSTFTQSAYRWYVDSDTNAVSDPWGDPNLVESTALLLLPATNRAPTSGSELRLRAAVTIGTDDLSATSQQFKLQYKAGTDSSCTTGSWTDVGASGGGSIWRYATSSVTDGATLSGTVLTGSDIAGVYAKSGPTATNPNSATVGQDVEYDFHIEQNGAGNAALYSFRMVESDGTELNTYSQCPTLSTAQVVGQELRHGNVFGNEVERGFTRAD